MPKIFLHSEICDRNIAMIKIYGRNVPTHRLDIAIGKLPT